MEPPNIFKILQRKVLIKPGFVCHVMVLEMDWKPFVYHVLCLKIKPKTCLVKRRNFNILEPRQVFVAVNVGVCMKVKEKTVRYEQEAT